MKRLALLFVLTLTAAAFADKIVLKDGRIYEGIILEESENSVQIKTSKATLTFTKDKVESIERSPAGPLQEREARLGALDPAKPGEYLALAKWLCSTGREAFDLPTVRRLCTIASKLDRAQAWEAQMLLSKEAEAAGQAREAGYCLVRAELAKPGQAETKTRIDALRAALMRDAQIEMEGLQKALNLIVTGKLEEALPKLRKSMTGAMSERASDFAGMSLEQMAKEVARRVMCKTCSGEGDLLCTGCSGAKESACTACEGTGSKKNFTGGKDATLLESACKTCRGLGKLLCWKCKAERDVIVYLAAAPTTFTVRVVGGSELDTLAKDIDFRKFTYHAVRITMILAQDPVSGGRVPCKDCEGVKYDPTAVPLPMDKIRAYRDAITSCLDGSKPYDPLPSADKVWDPAVIADEFMRYRNGRWAR